MAMQVPKGVLLSAAEAKRLARLYMQAELEILRQLDRAMSRGNDLRYLRNLLNNVQNVIEDLLDGSRTWTEEAIPRVYRQGLEEAEIQLQKAGLIPRFGFGTVHQQAVKVLADNVFQRLSDVTQVIGRRVEDIYREVALETTRQSIIGYKTWKQVANEYRGELRARGITAFRDAAGRNWNMATYCEMVARTTTMEAHLAGTGNRLLETGHDLVKVSTHGGACEKCIPWEGEIISLTGKTPGYPTLDEAKSMGLFHPNCRHTFYWQLGLGEAERQAKHEDVRSENMIEPTKTVNPGTIEPVNPITDTDKFKALSYKMQTHGWEGRPILVYDTGGGYQALTGSHRIYAAIDADIDIPIYEISPTRNLTKVEQAVFDGLPGLIRDDDRFDAIQELYAKNAVSRDAFLLMHAELKTPAETFDGSLAKKYDALKAAEKAAAQKAEFERNRKEAEDLAKRLCSPAKQELDNYLGMLKVKYENVWSEATDKELETLERLEAAVYKG